MHLRARYYESFFKIELYLSPKKGACNKHKNKESMKHCNVLCLLECLTSRGN